jgi:biotin transport system substrate-specific component
MSTTPLPVGIPRPVLADRIPGARVRDLVLTAGFTLAIALGAQVAIPLPFTPVPVTGQTFVVLLGAAALGAGRATVGAAAYGLIGLIGVPWFAVSSGASLGYVAGFVVAAWLVGAAARRGWVTSVGRTAVVMVGANLAIYALGVPVLALVLGVGPTQALVLGVVPFLLGDLIKIAAATALLPAVTRWLQD